MTYRFSTIGEKSSTQIVYEWLEQNSVGFEFICHDLPSNLIERHLVSSACMFLEEKGCVETIGWTKIKVKDKKGKTVCKNTRVYRYLKPYDGKFKRAQPKGIKRNRSKAIKHKNTMFMFPEITKTIPNTVSNQQDYERLHTRMILGKVSDILLEALIKIEGLIDQK